MSGLGNELTAPLILSLSKDELREESPDIRGVVRQAHHERTLFGERIGLGERTLFLAWTLHLPRSFRQKNLHLR